MRAAGATLCRRRQRTKGGHPVGLIRKSLMVGTAGLVRGSSKKQRVAKAQLKELRKQTAVLETAQAESQRRELLEEAAPTDRNAAVHRQVEAAAAGASGVEASMRKWAAIRANQAALERQPEPVALPAQGYYPDPDREHLLRWWDGQRWTERTAPRA